MEPMLVNDVEASRLLGVSRSKFHILVAQGWIPRLKIGRSARYRPADCLAFAERLASQAADGGATGIWVP
jgi:excisionase family DNA binding protein